jgi:hypothetical protein
VDLVEGGHHLGFDGAHPQLNGSLSPRHLLKLEAFLLRRVHTQYLGSAAVEGERRRVVEELEHVLLHGHRVRRAEDLKQLVVG